MRLHLRQIEVRPGISVEQRGGVVKEVQAEVEEGRGDRLVVDEHMSLEQMPTARAHDQRRCTLVEPVRLAVGILERELTADGVDQVALPCYDVLPCGRQRILEVGHETARTRVERIDHHLALDRTGDLDAAVLEIARRGRDSPLALADARRGLEKPRRCAGIELALPLSARTEERLARGVELPVETRDKRERVVREDALGVGRTPVRCLDALRCASRHVCPRM